MAGGRPLEYYAAHTEMPVFDALSPVIALTFVGVLAIGALIESWIDGAAARRSERRRNSPGTSGS